MLPPLPDDFEDELEEESVKIVRLVKNKEPLVSHCDIEDDRGMGERDKMVEDERMRGYIWKWEVGLVLC